MTDQELFQTAQRWIAWAEGSGFTNDPDDAGGPTRAGMTEGAWHEWEDFQGRPHTPVKGASAEEIDRAYFDCFWSRPRAVDVARCSWPIGLCFYDSCVVQGRSYSPRMLQQVVRAPVDGIVGPQTLNRVRLRALEPGGAATVVDRMLAQRRQRFLWTTRQVPGDRKFLTGWLNRLIRLRAMLQLPPPEWEASDREVYGCVSLP